MSPLCNTMFENMVTSLLVTRSTFVPWNVADSSPALTSAALLDSLVVQHLQALPTSKSAWFRATHAVAEQPMSHSRSCSGLYPTVRLWASKDHFAIRLTHPHLYQSYVFISFTAKPPKESTAAAPRRHNIMRLDPVIDRGVG